MSDTQTDTQEPDIRSLRAAAEAGKTAQTELAQAKRELMFAKAGIDTDTKLGSMLFKTFEGDDPEALKAEAAEVGYTIPGSQPRGATADDAQQGQFRDNLATGRTPDAFKEGTPDPTETALSEFQQDLKRGVPRESAQLAAIDRVLVAGVIKDPRVVYNPPKNS
jgi:hypothetical protein